MSEGAFEVQEIEKIKEIVDLQASLWKAVQRIPEGAERQKALREMSGFQNRMAALVRRFNSVA